jgi:hypothetical protein
VVAEPLVSILIEIFYYNCRIDLSPNLSISLTYLCILYKLTLTTTKTTNKHTSDVCVCFYVGYFTAAAVHIFQTI